MDDSYDEVHCIRAANDIYDFVTCCNLQELVTDDSRITEHHAVGVPLDLQSKLFDILKTNMKDIYESTSWGWKEREKQNELFHPSSRFLILKSPSGEVTSFVMFRFEWDDEDEPEHPCMFCYELQVSPSHQRKGHGKILMNMLLRISSHCRMWKTMLTCFKSNVSAMTFYQRIGFGVDSNSPSCFGHMDEDYEILSDKPKLR